MSLRARVVTGLTQLSSSTAWVVLVGFIQTVVLSRLLEPRDFGLTAMIWVFLGFAQMFCDAGVTNAIVQRPDITPAQLSTLYWLTLAAGAGIALLCAAATPYMVAYFREPDLGELVPWAALTFVVGAAGQPFEALAKRNLRFDRLALADVLATTLAFAVSAAAAFQGAGALALVFGGLASSLARTSWFVAGSWTLWRPAIQFRAGDLRSFRRFALFQMGDRIANYVWNNADYFLVGRVLGSGPLGIYRLAYETVVRPLGTLNPMLNVIALPAFAKRQDHQDRLREGLLEMVRMIAVFVFPMMAGLCVLAPLAVETVFGPAWTPAARIIQILAPLGALRCLLNPGSTLLIALGRVDRIFYLNLSLALLAPITYWLVLPLGLETMAFAALVLLAGVMVASWRSFYWSTIRLSPATYLTALLKPGLLSVAMATLVYVVQDASAAVVTSPVVRLALLVMVGTLTYAGLTIAFDRSYIKRLLSYRGQV
jgi:lipopolysaccharide exporter